MILMNRSWVTGVPLEVYFFIYLLFRFVFKF